MFSYTTMIYYIIYVFKLHEDKHLYVFKFQLNFELEEFSLVIKKINQECYKIVDYDGNVE